MLQSFTVRNYLSYKKETKLDFVASSIRQKSDYTFSPNDTSSIRLLKSVALYGYNSSGKSNLLSAIGYMKYAILNSNNSNFKFDVNPFLLDEENIKEPTSFQIVFYSNNVKYRYEIQIFNNTVFTEALFYTEPKLKETYLFVRTSNEILVNKAWNKKNKRIIDSLVSVSKLDTLFLSILGQLNIKPINDIISWFKKIVVIEKFDDRKFIEFTASMMENEYYKHNIISLLKSANLNIESISVNAIEKRIESKKYSNDFISAMLDEELNTQSSYEIKTIHNYYKGNKIIATKSFDLFQNESAGTRKFFGLIGFFIDAIIKKKIVIIDELDSKFDSLLLNAILLFYNDKKFNSSKSQLLFSSHNTILLKKNSLRRDQIYTITNDNYDGSTLTRLHGGDKLVRTDKSIEKEYYSSNKNSPQLDMFSSDGSLGFNE